MKRPSTDKVSKSNNRNWSAYNQTLKYRGSIELWMTDEVVDNWFYRGETQRGAQYYYSETAIELLLIFRAVYRLPYRQLQGFAEGIFRRAGLELPIPDYSLISRRARFLKRFTPTHPANEKLYIVMDSTGLKVYGEGEWKVRKHGWNKHRTWQKLHVAVDESTGRIEACELTTNSITDADVVGALLDQINYKITKMAGDGAYDRTKVYTRLKKEEIEPVIPPQKNARIQYHGNKKGERYSRDEIIRSIKRDGRKKWKVLNNYHRRSIAETTMYRYKTIFGGSMQCRSFDNQKAEVYLKCKILNGFNSLAQNSQITSKIAA